MIHHFISLTTQLTGAASFAASGLSVLLCVFLAIMLMIFNKIIASTDNVSQAPNAIGQRLLLLYKDNPIKQMLKAIIVTKLSASKLGLFFVMDNNIGRKNTTGTANEVNTPTSSR